MKVCLLNDSFPPVIDGVVNAVLNYAEILNRDGIETIVGTPYYENAGYSDYPYKVIPYPSLDTSALTSGYRAGYPFPIKEIASMAAFEPDVIHTHCPVSSAFVARSLRDVTDAPVVLTWHTKYDMDIHNVIGDNILADESIKALITNVSACDEVWTVSDGAGKNLQSLGYQGDYRVVLNGVDFPKGKITGPQADAMLQKYDLPASVPVFLYVGRIMNYKGLPLIIDALQMLSAKGYDYRMIFTGSGGDRQSLIDKITASGIACDCFEGEQLQTSIHSGSSLPGRIIMTGPVSDRMQLRMINSRADLFVFPSVFDTNGLVVREAAACGLASVLIRGSCAAEGISDGINGFLCEENSASLSAVLEQACLHTDVFRAAGERAMDEIYISWQDAVRTAEGLYADLIRRKKSGALPRRESFDDPLFDMAADAVRRYMHTVNEELPVYEGMIENFIDRRETMRNDLEARIRSFLNL